MIVQFLYVVSLCSTTTGTSLSCGIVAGAAAQVLEKYPDFTPQEVKKHLVSMATEDAIDFSTLPRWEMGYTSNRLLYTGSRCVGKFRMTILYTLKLNLKVYSSDL